MSSFFHELFDYNHQMNQALLQRLETDPAAFPEKSLTLLNHILNAHRIWNNRIKPGQETVGVWEQHPADTLTGMDAENHKKTLQILDTADLGAVLDYTTSRGQAFRNRVQDILFHVINHGTYHRGQIAMDMRQHGAEPLATDFIFYKR